MADCTVESSLADAGTLAFRVAMKLLRHREDAEDVAQEACVRALKRFPTLRDRTRFQSWLVRVAWRLAIDRRRADVRRGFRDARVVPNGHTHTTVEQDLIARERERYLQEAIDELPNRLREPLVLSGIDGHSVDEVAQRLQLPAGTIKSRSFEARRRLRRTLMSVGFLVLVGVGVRSAFVRVGYVDQAARLSGPLSGSLAQPQVVAAGPHVAAPQVASAKPVATGVVHQTAVATPEEPLSINPVPVPVVTIPTLAAPETGAPAVVVIPLVRVLVVKVPVVEVPVVNGSATTAASGHLEK